MPECPKQELPDAVKWGPEKWSPDYRNKNRIETYDTGTSPCKTACPAHIAVQGYLKLAAQGRYRDALALIKRENPLPAICGRICNRRCEDACTRGRIDAAVAIDEVKKFIAQQDLVAENRYVPEVVTPTRAGGFDDKIAVIGAGPAGLSCAFYLAEKGYKPVIFEKSARPGGMLTYGIPSYKLEKDVIEAEVEIIREMGVDIRLGVEVGRDVTLDELREQGFKAFYVAIGCQGGRLPGIPGEAAEGVSVAVDFLRGVAEQQDGGGEAAPMPGRTIVVGGGNVAIDVARTAARLGSEHVEMFCLESAEDMPASTEEVVEANEDGVHISCGWGPVEVRTGEDGRVSEIVFKRCLRVFNDEGRFDPTYDEGELRTVSADRVVFSIGQSILWGDLLEGEAVELGRGQGAVAIPRPIRPPSPTSLWAATSTPARSSPSTPSPLVTRPRFPSTASCRARRSPSAAIPAPTASSTATTWSSAATIRRAVATPCTTMTARRRSPFVSMSRPSPRSRSALRPRAAWAAVRASSTRTSASAAACVPPSVRSTPSTCTASIPSALTW